MIIIPNTKYKLHCLESFILVKTIHRCRDVMGYRDHVERYSRYKGAWCNRKSMKTRRQRIWMDHNPCILDRMSHSTSFGHIQSLKHTYQNKTSYK